MKVTWEGEERRKEKGKEKYLKPREPKMKSGQRATATQAEAPSPI